MKMLRKTVLLVCVLICVAMLATNTNAQQSVEDAVAWAEGEVGSNCDAQCSLPNQCDKHWAYRCMHFCGHAYGVVPSNVYSAISGWNNYDDIFGMRFTSTNYSGIPRGALVFFGTSLYVDGHVGISVGNGEMIHAWTSGVIRSNISDYSQHYLGWRWPNAWTNDEHGPVMLDCESVEQEYPQIFEQEDIYDCREVYFLPPNTYSIAHYVYTSMYGYWGITGTTFTIDPSISPPRVLGANTAVPQPQPLPPPNFSDPGDEGTSSGPDGNVKRVEVSSAGQNSWQHALSHTQGFKFDIEVTLTNKGDTPIANAEVEYYLSDNLTFNESMDTRLGQSTGVAIAPGGALKKHLNGITITRPGTYYIFCKIEATGDHNSSNDFSRHDDSEEYAVVSIGWPDFITSSLFFPGGRTTFGPNITAKLCYVLDNIGAGTSPIDIPVVYLFNFTPFASSLVSRVDLEAGESKAGEFLITTPSVPGTYTYSVCPDGYNNIVEANELGNCQNITIEVKDFSWLVPLIEYMLD